MKIFPAIDLYQGKAVRLYKGDYQNMTVYSDNPVSVAKDFKDKGAEWIHLVDLEGAKNGLTPNAQTVENIVKQTGLKAEIGGGIRSIEVIEKYLSIGVSRVILGTSAVTDRDFLTKAVEKYGDKIAVGVDIKDGKVAIKGWTEKSELDGLEFIKELVDLGVKTVICTDISRDGAMKGANHELYKTLKDLDINVIASGGVSSIEDIKILSKIGVHGAILGKAYYTGAVNLKEAIEVAKC
jgi:phosphoribosylformimino-5-aminoimidazole carboxamide ribotide isomerase